MIKTVLFDFDIVYSGLSLLYFWSSKSLFSLELLNLLPKLNEKYPELNIYSIAGDHVLDLSKENKVKNFPTFILFKNRQLLYSTHKNWNFLQKILNSNYEKTR